MVAAVLKLSPSRSSLLYPMPELPEVETVRRTLEPAVGSVITTSWGSGKPLHMNRAVPYAKIKRFVPSARIDKIRRYGKYLLVDLVHPSKKPHSLLVHLGMTGRLRIHPVDEPHAAHTHLVMKLKKRGSRRVTRELRYSDIRRFGQIDLLPSAAEHSHPALSVLGLDPLLPEFDGPFLYEKARRSGQGVKTFLLNQKIIAGIGNIYASEALWLSRIRPSIRANSLSKARSSRLAEAVTGVLNNALTNGGTSLKDFVAADGAQGSHSDYLLVYGRQGEACARKGCKGTIRRTVIQGRATFHCPKCQER